jgi:release factor glutamine methyltransferase
MLVKEVVEKSNQFLKSKGIESSRLDAELIIAHILKMERIALYLKYDQPLTEEEKNLCRMKILERSKGLPVAYILNHKYFYNYEFFVNKNVLIPRPETELMVEETLCWIKQCGLTEISYLELGSGSGCISISLAAELQKVGIGIEKAIALDVSEQAIEVSHKNARKILNDKQPIDFVLCDAATFSTQKVFDIILANPPYIAIDDTNVQKSVREFEPHLALYAEDNGMFCIKAWGRNAVKFLKPKGFVMFEIGFKQGPEALNIFRDMGVFFSVELIKDFSGENRFIKAVRNG